MPRRIDVELTSTRPDGTWTWRAAGARQPKGELDGSLLFAGAKVGDVVKAEADFDIDGITITAIQPPKGSPERAGAHRDHRRPVARRPAGHLDPDRQGRPRATTAAPGAAATVATAATGGTPASDAVPAPTAAPDPTAARGPRRERRPRRGPAASAAPRARATGPPAPAGARAPTQGQEAAPGPDPSQRGAGVAARGAEAGGRDRAARRHPRRPPGHRDAERRGPGRRAPPSSRPTP